MFQESEMIDFDFDFEIALREITETEEDIEEMVLSKEFHCEFNRIREELKVSPYLAVTDEMCKWVILAHLRSEQLISTELSNVLGSGK